MNEMRRPKVTLENQEAVYDYYEKRKPVPANARFLHKLFGMLYRSHVSFADGAQEKIDSHFSQGGRFLLVANHKSASDQFVLASLAEREPVLHPLRANTVIPGKAPIFRVGIIRPFIDNFVALPTFRGKDVAKSPLSSEKAQLLRAQATKRLIEICIAHADEGMNIAIFPHGTRKPGNGVRSGIGQIACGVENPDNLLILPVGIDYDNTRTGLAPNVFVGTPFGLPGTPDEVTTQVEASIQDSVYMASCMKL